MSRYARRLEELGVPFEISGSDAFAENAEATTEHVLAAIGQTRPVSVLMREHVEELRAWARGRCVPAD